MDTDGDPRDEEEVDDGVVGDEEEEAPDTDDEIDHSVQSQ